MAINDRRCGQCGYPTSGHLRMTLRLDGALVLACEDCALDLEREKDREPPEPDGEAFRGGEAAAYEREQMAEWQKLK